MPRKPGRNLTALCHEPEHAGGAMRDGAIEQVSDQRFEPQTFCFASQLQALQPRQQNQG